MYGNGKHEIMKEKKLPQYLQWQNLSFIPLLSSCSALVISPLSFTCIQCCISHAPSSPVTLTTSFLQSSLLCNSHSVRNSIIPRRWISVPQERLRSPFPKALDQINWSFPPPRTHTHISEPPMPTKACMVAEGLRKSGLHWYFWKWPFPFALWRAP